MDRPRKTTKAVIPQERHLSHHRPDTNKRRVIWIVALCLISIEIPEIPTYLTYVWPRITTTERDWFWLYGFHYKMAEYWYWKETACCVAWIVRMIAFTKTAVQYSTTVFLAAFLILVYIVFDLFMFWINYNQWPWVYEFMILFIYIVGRSLVLPFKPDAFCKVKSLF